MKKHLKKILFWVSFVPMGILMLLVAIPAGILEFLDCGLTKVLSRFERWALEVPDFYYWYEDGKPPMPYPSKDERNEIAKSN